MESQGTASHGVKAGDGLEERRPCTLSLAQATRIAGQRNPVILHKEVHQQHPAGDLHLCLHMCSIECLAQSSSEVQQTLLRRQVSCDLLCVFVK